MRKLQLLQGMLAGILLPATAQTISINYTTEFQYGIQSNRANWCNLLRTDVALPIAQKGSLDLALIHFYKVKERPVLTDRMTFSNIEEENVPAAIALLGYQQEIGHSRLFLGIRNMNEDYFTASAMSLFTNSSCGIFPTISVNYPIANYPVAALCVHYVGQWNQWRLQGSIYNGKAYSGWNKADNPFRLKIKQDGVFGLSEINYETDYGIFNLGVGLHNRLPLCDDVQPSNSTKTPGEKTSPTYEEKQMSAIGWAYAEQTIWNNQAHALKLLAQFSQNTSAAVPCQQYAAFGSVWSYQNNKQQTFETGVVYTRGKFGNAFESDTEITCRYQFRPTASIQPALHLIHNPESVRAVLLVRFSYTFSK